MAQAIDALIQHLTKVRTADRAATMAWVRFGVWLNEPAQAKRKAEAILDTLPADRVDSLLPKGRKYTLSRMSQAKTIAKQYIVDGGQRVESLRDFSMDGAYFWRPSESEMSAAEVVQEKRTGKPPAAKARKAGKRSGKARGKQVSPASGAIGNDVRNDRAKITMSRATFRKLNALRGGDDWDTFLTRLADQGRSAGKARKARNVSKRNTSTA